MNGRVSAACDPSMVFMKPSPKDSDINDGDSQESTEGYLKVLSPAPSRTTKTITICRMWGRYKGIRMPRYVFIMLCLATVLLLILLGIIIVLYAIVPSIVRSTIAKAQISFRSVNIEQVEADRFRLRAQLELSRTGSIGAAILPPLIIDVNNVGVVTNREKISIAGDANRATVVPVDAPFIVSSLEAFHNFSRSLIFESRIVWHLTAKASVQPISRHMPVYSNIPFDKEVTLDGLNGLQKVGIKSVSLRRSDAKRIYVDILIDIANPSLFSVDVGRLEARTVASSLFRLLGQLKFTLRHREYPIGYVQSVDTNVTLRPDNNTVAFSGELQTTSPNAYVALSEVIQNYLTGRASQVAAVAGPDATSYPLLAVAMNGLTLTVQLPAFDEQLIPALTFDSMSLVPSKTERQVLLSASITIGINSPLGQSSPLDIDSMDMDASLVYQGQDVGTLTISRAPVEQLTPTNYHTEFHGTALILSGTGEAYVTFVQHFIGANQTHPIEFRIVGSASITAHFALGPLEIKGIKVDNTVSLVGLEGFNRVLVRGISVDGEQESALQLTINATIDNPGVSAVQLQDFTLQMSDTKSGTILGRVPVPILSLQPGSNDITLNG